MITIPSNNVSQNAPAQEQTTDTVAVTRKSTSQDKFTGSSRAAKALLGTLVLGMQAVSASARGLRTPWSENQGTVSPFTAATRQSAGGNQAKHGWTPVDRGLLALDGAYRPSASAPVVSAPGPFAPHTTPLVPGPVGAEPNHWLAPNTAPGGAGAPDSQG